MPLDFDTVTKAIQSPPGQLAAGSILAGFVWKFFERIEGLLTDQTKFEIAVWLVGVNTAAPIALWSKTVTATFDRLFGAQYLSVRAFLRSCLVTSILIALTVLLSQLWGSHRPVSWFVRHPYWVITATLLTSCLFDFLSLLKSRFLMHHVTIRSGVPLVCLILTLDLMASLYIAGLNFRLATGLVDVLAYGRELFKVPYPPLSIFLKDRFLPFLPFNRLNWLTLTQLGLGPLWYFPAFFAPAWVWLYAGSGLLLKAARKVDVGFNWFNDKFDIERHPLQALGLVAGAIVAAGY